MIIDVTEQELGVIMNGLLELPAKNSYALINKLSAELMKLRKQSGATPRGQGEINGSDTGS